MKNKIKKWFHDKFGYGYPKNVAEFDGFQEYAECKFCNHSLCKDSTGVWFHLSRIINNLKS